MQTVSKPVVPFEQLKLKAQFSMNNPQPETGVAKQTETAATEPIATNDAKELTQDLVKQGVQQFAQMKQDAGARQLFATLTTANLSLNGSTVVIEVHNDAQREKLNEIRQDLLDFMRKACANSGLLIDIRVMQHQQESKVYKPADKFKLLADKNPMLLELKKRFDLDIEY